jgi:predicted nucleic acid-binding protein
MTKSKESPKHYYWDACVFLSAINANPDRLPIIESILDDCDRGKVEIYTSILSIAEVAYAYTEKDCKKLDEETEKKIDKFWLPPSPIKLVEIGEPVLWDAKALMRAAIVKGRSLKPADAIHLATANRLPVDTIHTYDRLLSHSDLAKCPIALPAITDRFVFTTEEKPKDASEKMNGTASATNIVQHEEAKEIKP